MAVVREGDLDCAVAFGEANRESGTPNAPETVFSIGSISKSFTAAAILDLVERGRLRLDDSAGELIPELRGPASGATVEQLLSHTSGLTGTHSADHQPLSESEAITSIGALESAFEPGSGYGYSNAGYTLLALIIERVAGSGYRELMAADVLQDAEGDQIGGFWDGEPHAPDPRAVGYLDGESSEEVGDFSGPHWALEGNGDLAMTAAELASWTASVFTGEILSPGVGAEIAKPRVSQGRDKAETFGWVRIGTSRFGTPLLLSAGGGGDIGHDAVVVWAPREETAVAIASNTDEIKSEELIGEVGQALIGEEPVPVPETAAATVDPAELTAAEGTYELDGGGSLGVASANSGIEVSASGANAIATLLPIADRFPAETVAGHEAAVLALLDGGTREGRRELAVLERMLGPLDRSRLAGTAAAEGELRTYVELDARDGPVLGWYALDDAGAIAAVEVPTQAPSQLFVPDGDGGYVPDDPTGELPEVRIAFEGSRMTIDDAEATRR